MSYEVPGLKLGTLTASADLSAKQYRAVKVSGAGTVTVSASATDKSIGILQNKPASGGSAEIMTSGVTKVETGAAVAAGAQLMANADGKLVTATGAGARVLGVALEASAADGVIVPMLIGIGEVLAA